MGGESIITETAGGFAPGRGTRAAALPGRSAQAMIDRNRELYRITVGEHKLPDPAVRLSRYATGIDAQGRQHRDHPVMDVGIPGRDGTDREPGSSAR